MTAGETHRFANWMSLLPRRFARQSRRIGQWLARQLDEDPWARDRIRLLNERFAIDRTAAENEDQEADLWAAKEAAVKDLRMALLTPWTDKLRTAYL